MNLISALPEREANYSMLQKGLQGISTLVMMWLMVSGYYVAFISRSGSIKEAVGAFNVSLGSLFIPLFLYSFSECTCHWARVVWLCSRPKPLCRAWFFCTHRYLLSDSHRSGIRGFDDESRDRGLQPRVTASLGIRCGAPGTVHFCS